MMIELIFWKYNKLIFFTIAMLKVRFSFKAAQVISFKKRRASKTRKIRLESCEERKSSCEIGVVRYWKCLANLKTLKKSIMLYW